MSDTKEPELQKKVKASDHDSYGVLTIVALLIPLVGFIAGAIYLTKDTKLDRKVGEHLFAVGVLSSIIFGGIFYVLFYGTTQSYTTGLPTNPTYTQPSAAPVSTWDVEGSYAKIKAGMTKPEVESAIAKTAANCSKSEQSNTTDVYATCTYGDVGVDKGLIVVNYMNDKVTTFEKSTY